MPFHARSRVTILTIFSSSFFFSFIFFSASSFLLRQQWLRIQATRTATTIGSNTALPDHTTLIFLHNHHTHVRIIPVLTPSPSSTTTMAASYSYSSSSSLAPSSGHGFGRHHLANPTAATATSNAAAQPKPYHHPRQPPRPTPATARKTRHQHLQHHHRHHLRQQLNYATLHAYNLPSRRHQQRRSWPPSSHANNLIPMLGHKHAAAQPSSSRNTTPRIIFTNSPSPASRTEEEGSEGKVKEKGKREGDEVMCSFRRRRKGE